MAIRATVAVRRRSAEGHPIAMTDHGTTPIFDDLISRFPDLNAERFAAAPLPAPVIDQRADPGAGGVEPTWPGIQPP